MAQGLAPLWLAVVVLGIEWRRPMVAGLAFVAAVHNHPLALGTFPLLLALPWERRSLRALVGPALLLPHLVGLAGQPVGVGGGEAVNPLPALLAWWETEDAGAGLATAGISQDCGSRTGDE